MKIENENYILDYNEEAHIVKINGSLRLNGLDEYAPVLDVLMLSMEKSNKVTIDLSELEFLNSSGIAMLSKLIIHARGQEDLSLTILGSVKIPWQGKSLKNLQRLFPALELNIS